MEKKQNKFTNQKKCTTTLPSGWVGIKVLRSTWQGDGGDSHWFSPDGVAPSWMVGVSASVNLLLHCKVQKFSSGTGSPGWFQWW